MTARLLLHMHRSTKGIEDDQEEADAALAKEASNPLNAARDTAEQTVKSVEEGTAAPPK